MSGLTVTLVTVLIIVLSAFFVAIEFSLMAAKRHRFEDAAPRSAAARAALRASSDLTLVLAGSQLGITLCTLALGAITKPAVHHALEPVLAGWGLPHGVADVASFVLALVIVTFLHLVVGEMAPKSWAIAHPERSATLLALPMQAFMFVTRPFLVALNHAANWMVRKLGAEPVDELSSGMNATELRALVEHSANAGALDIGYRESIEQALTLSETKVADLVASARPTSVAPDATVADLQAATVRHGHMRVLLRDGDRVEGVVHVRDTLGLPAHASASQVARPALTVGAGKSLHEAFAEMRRTQSHLAVVMESGRVVGVVTLDDILVRLFPRTSTVEKDRL